MGIFSRLHKFFSAYIATTSDRLERAAGDVEREEERARAEVEDILAKRRTVATSEIPSSPVTLISAPLAAYKVLGLSIDADLASVEERWRGLIARADPKRFPSGSEEEKQAALILDRVNEAYRQIRNYLNPTGGRFEKLEL